MWNSPSSKLLLPCQCFPKQRDKSRFWAGHGWRVLLKYRVIGRLNTRNSFKTCKVPVSWTHSQRNHSTHLGFSLFQVILVSWNDFLTEILIIQLWNLCVRAQRCLNTRTLPKTWNSFRGRLAKYELHVSFSSRSRIRPFGLRLLPLGNV